MRRSTTLISLFIVLNYCSEAQQLKTLPREFFQGPKPLTFRNILSTSKGPTLVTHSMGLAEIDKMQIEVSTTNVGVTDKNGKNIYLGKNSNILKDLYPAAGIKLCVEGPDRILFVVSNNNNFGVINYNLTKAIGYAPFNFNNAGRTNMEVSKIWIDPLGTLFIASNNDSIYFVTGATRGLKDLGKPNTVPSFLPGLDKDSNFLVIKGALPVQSFSFGPKVIPYSFADDPEDSRLLWVGTNNGIYAYDKRSRQTNRSLKPAPNEKLTITNLELNKSGTIIWFSTLEKGMGKLNTITNDVNFFLYPKLHLATNSTFPIRTFSKKSKNEYFVAIADSVPAIFDTETGKYTFILDTLFKTSKDETSDIKADAFGTLYVCKGGLLYWAKNWMQNNSKTFSIDSTAVGPFITGIKVNGNQLDAPFFGKGWDDTINNVRLKNSVDLLEIHFSSRGIDPDSLSYSWKLEGLNNEWTDLPYSFFGDGTNWLYFEKLKAGNYTLHVKAKKDGTAWVTKEINLNIFVEPPFWLTWWFWLACIAGISTVIGLASFLSARKVRKQERIKAKYEKDALELEAKALRSQLNPHFIFNCMNSIKSLINQNENEKANKYLTTFSKLMRTVFQNSDKREINLYEEIETCRLYVQLESMRFGSKLHYEFNIDSSIDLKSVPLPALIIQPFLENSIWHGIMPKEAGGSLIFSVEKRGPDICCIIDDDGVGREMSKQNKFRGEPSTHESKGVHLTQNRLDVDNMLTDRHTKVEIIDKKDDQGNSLGTRVIVTFQDI